MSVKYIDLSGLQYLVNLIVFGIVSPKYSSSSTYVVGDYCLHSCVLYRCSTAITVAEAWNAAHWTATTIKNELKTLTTAVGSSGSVVKANQLTTARYINGMSFNGTADINNYGTCSVVAATAAKTVSLSGYALKTGGRCMVKFTYENSATAPTLNINATGAKAIKAFGTTEPTIWWVAGDVVEFVYDGTNYIMLPSMGMIENLKAKYA